MSGQHNESGGHEPKRVVTDKRNIDEYRNHCELRDNERNYIDVENVEHADAFYRFRTSFDVSLYIVRKIVLSI